MQAYERLRVLFSLPLLEFLCLYLHRPIFLGTIAHISTHNPYTVSRKRKRHLGMQLELQYEN